MTNLTVPFFKTHRSVPHREEVLTWIATAHRENLEMRVLVFARKSHQDLQEGSEGVRRWADFRIWSPVLGLRCVVPACTLQLQ